MFKIINNFSEKADAQMEMRKKAFISKLFWNFLKAAKSISIIVRDVDIVF